MPVDFREETLQSRIVEKQSSGEMGESTYAFKLRFDPLTGQTCRLLDYRYRLPERQNLSDLAQTTSQSCPFCRPTVKQITPRFPSDIVPEGAIELGESFTFPNAKPYDVYSAITVISGDHFIALPNFTSELIHTGLLASQDYLRRVGKVDSQAKYSSITWNYMPPSGGSVVHPHLQSNAGYLPTQYQKRILENSQRYQRENGTNFWNDLIRQERELGKRYIGSTGNVHWIASFAPKALLVDVQAIFEGKASITELSNSDLKEFADGLVKVFWYMDERNLQSFNLSIYSGEDENNFWTHARVISRSFYYYSPITTSDRFFYHVLHDEEICTLPPENVCEDLRGIMFPSR
ncbi:MAG: hypothetical protein ACOC6S_01230 [Chloroflexota bacterium]